MQCRVYSSGYLIIIITCVCSDLIGVVEAMNVNESLFQSIRVLNASQNMIEYEVCLFQPAHTSSLGLWGKYIFAGPPMLSSFPVFMLQIMVIFLTTQACHFLLKRLGFSFLISQMMVGIIIFVYLFIHSIK